MMARPLIPWSILTPLGSRHAAGALDPASGLRRLWRWSRHLAQARAARLAAAREHAAREACAAEGADIEFGSVELDGRRFGALYRGGLLVCLLPEIDRL